MTARDDEGRIGSVSPNILAGCALVFAGLAIIFFGPVLWGGFFSDDWEFLTREPRRHILGAFFETHPYTFYRPIEWSLSALFQTLFGPTTFPLHLANLLFHVALAVLTFRVLRVFGATVLGAFLGGTLVTVSQVAAGSVGGNDTLSNTLGALAGCTAMWWMYPSPHRGFRQRSSAAIAVFTVALFSKESSMGYLPVLCLLAVRGEGGGDPREPGTGVRLARVGAFVAIGLAFMAWRQRVGAVPPNFGPGGHMAIDRGLIVHPLMLWYAALVPVSTTHIFLGVQAHRWLWPAPGLAGTLMVGAISAWGAWKIGKSSWKWALGWTLAGTVSLAPAVLLRHVSQTESYALVPFVAVMFGYGAGELLRQSRSLAQRGVLGLALGAIFMSHAFASRYAAIAMARNGSIANAAMTRLLDVMERMPRGGTLLLVEPRLGVPNYSVIQMRGFVLAPEHELRKISRRGDVTIRTLSPDEPLPTPHDGQVAFTMSGEGELVEIRR